MAEGKALKRDGAVDMDAEGSDVVEPAPQTALDLDRLIHERMRLGIVSALAVNDHLSFNDLKRLLKTTDGNLSVHARKLEEAGYITCEKYFEGRVPKTEYRLAPPGRRALERYLDHMEAIIHATREG
ncbi:MAG TPA: transcriptional regulator [Thermoanaerobaculia bacterium]|nr:transcriptional regulator [Thermoanaerobaculia bacterium]